MDGEELPVPTALPQVFSPPVLGDDRKTKWSAAQEEARPGNRSPSSSSSSSSDNNLAIDDNVEVFGLRSEAGAALNGKRGTIVQYLKDQGRYEVCFGPEKLAALRKDNLRKIEPAADDQAEGEVMQDEAPPAGEKMDAEEAKPAAPSLASLLGMGRAEPAEEPKEPAGHQTVWARSGGDSGAELTEEQKDVINTLHADEEQEKADQAKLRKKVELEFAQAGVTDASMIDQVFQEQWEELKLKRLQRGRSRSRSRSLGRKKSKGEASGAANEESSGSSSSSSEAET
mmetsp:Transcript_6773/g.11910  ORF Transcript_6773/g.11910 Transcript_6773/m.11910 type:complete len:285 (-) Transcript_6773:89-943(-)